MRIRKFKITVGTTVVDIHSKTPPLTGLKRIKIVPLVAGNFYWGFDGSVDATNSETFTSASPVKEDVDGSVAVCIVKESGSGDVVIYEFSD